MNLAAKKTAQAAVTKAEKDLSASHAAVTIAEGKLLEAQRAAVHARRVLDYAKVHPDLFDDDEPVAPPAPMTAGPIATYAPPAEAPMAVRIDPVYAPMVAPIEEPWDAPQYTPPVEAPAETQPKRKRRTKAEMEAARAAEATEVATPAEAHVGELSVTGSGTALPPAVNTTDELVTVQLGINGDGTPNWAQVQNPNYVAPVAFKDPF